MVLFLSVSKVYANASFVNSWIKDGDINSTSDFSIAQTITPTTGNLLILFAITKKDLATSPVISGWTNRGFICAPNNNACTYSYSKIASGSETVTVLLDNMDKPNGATITILEYEGVYNTVHSSITNAGNSISVSTGNVTTPHNNELLIAIYASDNNSSHGTWSNGFTPRVNHSVITGNVKTTHSIVDLSNNTIGTYSTGTTLDKIHNWSTMFFSFDSIVSNTSDLILTKTVSNTNPAINQNFTYTLTVFNSGAMNNFNVQVTDTMPLSFSLVSTTPSAGTTYNRSTGIWDIGNLAYGETKTLSIVEYANTIAAGQTITNTATITSAGVSDSNLANNTATSTITVKSISSAPVLNTPIVSGDTTISGISSGGDGTAITIFNGDVIIGSAIVTGGVWSTTITTVSGGDQIKAKATFPGGSESDYSEVVTVLYKSIPPLVTVPVVAGSTQIFGTTVEANGTTIEIFLDNELIGTTTSSGGEWVLNVSKPTLIANQLLKVRAVAPGKYVSNFS